jgi:hypothetical protein
MRGACQVDSVAGSVLKSPLVDFLRTLTRTGDAVMKNQRVTSVDLTRLVELERRLRRGAPFLLVATFLVLSFAMGCCLMVALALFLTTG